jgi:lipid-binding SYLF domain-containing protein
LRLHVEVRVVGVERVLLAQVELAAGDGEKGDTEFRDAATDVVMNAEILSYSRAKGLFAGISLEGSTLRSDGSANEKLYGQKLSAKDIIRSGKVKTPASAQELVALLDKKSPKNQSDPKSLQ